MAPFIIADDSAGRGPGSKWLTDYVVDLEQKTMDIEPLEAQFGSRKSLGNWKTTHNFTAEFEFATADACFKFKSELPLYVPKSGLLKIQTVTGQQILYDNAVVSSVKPEDLGEVAVRLNWVVLSGKPRLVT